MAGVTGNSFGNALVPGARRAETEKCAGAARAGVCSAAGVPTCEEAFVNACQNLLRILKRTGGAYIPFCFGFTPAKMDEFRRRTGSDDVEMHYDFPFRNLSLAPSSQAPDYRDYYEGRELGADVAFNGDGVALCRGAFQHFTRMVSPLSGPQTTLADLETYPLDDRGAEYRFADVRTQAGTFHEQGYGVFGGAGSTFEAAWAVRGMEDMLMDLHTAPARAERLLERMTERNVVVARKYAEAGADIIGFGDDVGTQHGMLMSPDTWRRFLKPRLARQIRAARDVNPQVLIWYHSDGNIEPILPDLIEIGLDILNPVQPECMDPVQLKRQYGDSLSFWGTIGTQTTMPFGSPDDVRATVKKMVREVGFDGGLCLAPTHVLEPEVPWENIEAFVEACREHGRLA